MQIKHQNKTFQPLMAHTASILFPHEEFCLMINQIFESQISVADFLECKCSFLMF